MNNEYDEYGEPRRSNRRERPAQTSNRTVWIVVLTLGCGGALLCAVACAGLVFWGVQTVAKDLKPAQAASDQFLDRLKEGKIDDAYDMTSTRFRKDQSPAELATYVKRYETFTRHTSRTQNGVRFFQNGGGKQALFQITLHAPNNATTCTITLVEEDGVWKVDKITVP